jgi:hypothetical protein
MLGGQLVVSPRGFFSSPVHGSYMTAHKSQGQKMPGFLKFLAYNYMLLVHKAKSDSRKG